MKVLTAILLFTVFMGGSVESFARGRSSTVSVALHTEKPVPNARIKIKFVEMVEDSRCPTGTNCIWAGNAKVKIELTSRQRTQTFEINSFLQPTAVKFSGYLIKLASLTPKPAAGEKIDPSKYLAMFEVDKEPGK